MLVPTKVRAGVLTLVAVLAGALLAGPAERAAADTASCPGNPNALGVSRVVEIDTSGGPGFGFEHFRAHDFLKPGEIVLTFDDGPWPKSTPAVLAALAEHCTKATFFPIGKHATWHPEILREVARQGHTIGSHTWSHLDLSRLNPEAAKAELEMGVSAIRRTLGEQASPFFRFPALKHPPEMIKYAGERNLAIFSTDVDSFDFKLRTPEKLVTSIIDRMEKKGGGKGILLMHDFQQTTAKALPELLRQLKAKGYKVVHMKAKAPVTSLPGYDAMVVSQLKGPQPLDERPTSAVVRTVDDAAEPKKTDVKK